MSPTSRIKLCRYSDDDPVVTYAGEREHVLGRSYVTKLFVPGSVRPHLGPFHVLFLACKQYSSSSPPGTCVFPLRHQHVHQRQLFYMSGNHKWCHVTWPHVWMQMSSRSQKKRHVSLEFRTVTPPDLLLFFLITATSAFKPSGAIKTPLFLHLSFSAVLCWSGPVRNVPHVVTYRSWHMSWTHAVPAPWSVQNPARRKRGSKTQQLWRLRLWKCMFKCSGFILSLCLDSIGHLDSSSLDSASGAPAPPLNSL